MLAIQIKGAVVEVVDTVKDVDAEDEETKDGQNASVATVENSGILNASAGCQAMALINQEMMIQVMEAAVLPRGNEPRHKKLVNGDEVVWCSVYFL